MRIGRLLPHSLPGSPRLHHSSSSSSSPSSSSPSSSSPLACPEDEASSNEQTSPRLVKNFEHSNHSSQHSNSGKSNSGGVGASSGSGGSGSSGSGGIAWEDGGGSLATGSGSSVTLLKANKASSLSLARTIDDLLRPNPDDSLEYFRMFLVTEESGLEALHFYLEAESWRLFCDLNRAREIYEQSLSPRAPFGYSIAGDDLPEISEVAKKVLAYIKHYEAIDKKQRTEPAASTSTSTSGLSSATSATATMTGKESGKVSSPGIRARATITAFDLPKEEEKKKRTGGSIILKARDWEAKLAPQKDDGVDAAARKRVVKVTSLKPEKEKEKEKEEENKVGADGDKDKDKKAIKDDSGHDKAKDKEKDKDKKKKKKKRTKKKEKDPVAKVSPEDIPLLKNIFAEAQRSVYSFLKEKRFPGFLKSEFYREYLAESQAKNSRLTQWLNAEELDNLVLHMSDENEGGVAMKEKKGSRLSPKRRCFKGTDAVAWIMNYSRTSHEIAYSICQQLLDTEYIFRHSKLKVDDEKRFLEAKKNYYCFRVDEKTYLLNTKKLWTAEEKRPPNTVVSELLSSLLRLYRTRAGDESVIRSRSIPAAIRQSEEFRRIALATSELQKVDLHQLRTHEDKAGFFINLYNLLSLHANTQLEIPKNRVEFLHRLSKACYVVGGHEYSLQDIEYAILRAPSERLQVYGSNKLATRLKESDPRHWLRLEKKEPLLAFALNPGLSFGPPVRIYNASNLSKNLQLSAQEFLLANIDIQQKTNKGSSNTIHLPRVIQCHSSDFGSSEKEMLSFLFDIVLNTISSLNNDQVHKLNQLKKFSPSRNDRPVIKWKDYDWTFGYQMSSTAAVTRALNKVSSQRTVARVSLAEAQRAHRTGTVIVSTPRPGEHSPNSIGSSSSAEKVGGGSSSGEGSPREDLTRATENETQPGSKQQQAGSGAGGTKSPREQKGSLKSQLVRRSTSIASLREYGEQVEKFDTV